MTSSQWSLSKFTIPKKKRGSGNVFLEDCHKDHREYTCIRTIINESRLDFNYEFFSTLKCQDFKMVHNKQLAIEYLDKRTIMRSNGRQGREMEERFCFLVTTGSEAFQMYTEGVKIDTTGPHTLGNPKYGIYLHRHVDVALKQALQKTISVEKIVVFKVIFGKVKKVHPCLGKKTPPDPTIGFDSHFPKGRVTTKDSLHQQVIQSSIYLFDCSKEAEFLNRPRQCLPYAVISVGRMITSDTLKSLLPLEQQSSIRVYKKRTEFLQDSRPLLSDSSKLTNITVAERRGRGQNATVTFKHFGNYRFSENTQVSETAKAHMSFSGRCKDTTLLQKSQNVENEVSGFFQPNFSLNADQQPTALRAVSVSSGLTPFANYKYENSLKSFFNVPTLNMMNKACQESNACRSKTVPVTVNEESSSKNGVFPNYCYQHLSNSISVVSSKLVKDPRSLSKTKENLLVLTTSNTENETKQSIRTKVNKQNESKMVQEKNKKNTHITSQIDKSEICSVKSFENEPSIPMLKEKFQKYSAYLDLSKEERLARIHSLNNVSDAEKKLLYDRIHYYDKYYKTFSNYWSKNCISLVSLRQNSVKSGHQEDDKYLQNSVKHLKRSNVQKQLCAVKQVKKLEQDAAKIRNEFLTESTFLDKNGNCTEIQLHKQPSASKDNNEVTSFKEIICKALRDEIVQVPSTNCTDVKTQDACLLVDNELADSYAEQLFCLNDDNDESLIHFTEDNYIEHYEELYAGDDFEPRLYNVTDVSNVVPQPSLQDTTCEDSINEYYNKEVVTCSESVYMLLHNRLFENSQCDVKLDSDHAINKDDTLQSSKMSLLSVKTTQLYLCSQSENGFQITIINDAKGSCCSGPQTRKHSENQTFLGLAQNANSSPEGITLHGTYNQFTEEIYSADTLEDEHHIMLSVSGNVSVDNTVNVQNMKKREKLVIANDERRTSTSNDAFASCSKNKRSTNLMDSVVKVANSTFKERHINKLNKNMASTTVCRNTSVLENTKSNYPFEHEKCRLEKKMDTTSKHGCRVPENEKLHFECFPVMIESESEFTAKCDKGLQKNQSYEMLKPFRSLKETKLKCEVQFHKKNRAPAEINASANDVNSAFTSVFKTVTTETPSQVSEGVSLPHGEICNITSGGTRLGLTGKRKEQKTRHFHTSGCAIVSTKNRNLPSERKKRTRSTVNLKTVSETEMYSKGSNKRRKEGDNYMQAPANSELLYAQKSENMCIDLQLDEKQTADQNTLDGNCKMQDANHGELYYMKNYDKPVQLPLLQSNNNRNISSDASIKCYSTEAYKVSDSETGTSSTTNSFSSELESFYTSIYQDENNVKAITNILKQASSTSLISELEILRAKCRKMLPAFVSAFEKEQCVDFNSVFVSRENLVEKNMKMAAVPVKLKVSSLDSFLELQIMIETTQYIENKINFSKKWPTFRSFLWYDPTLYNELLKGRVGYQQQSSLFVTFQEKLGHDGYSVLRKYHSELFGSLKAKSAEVSSYYVYLKERRIREECKAVMQHYSDCDSFFLSLPLSCGVNFGDSIEDLENCQENIMSLIVSYSDRLCEDHDFAKLEHLYSILSILGGKINFLKNNQTSSHHISWFGLEHITFDAAKEIAWKEYQQNGKLSLSASLNLYQKNAKKISKVCEEAIKQMHEFFDEVNVPEQLSTGTIPADEDSKSKNHCDGNAEIKPTNKRKFMGFELLNAPPEKKRIQSVNCSEDARTALDLNAGNRPDQEDSVNSTIVKEAQQCSLDLVTPSAKACMDLQNVESVMCKSRILEEDGSCPTAEKTNPDNVEEKTLNSASDYNCGDPAFKITPALNVPSTSQSKDETFPTVDKIHPKGRSIPIVNQSRQHPFPLYGSKDSYSYQRKLGSEAHFSQSTNMSVKNYLSSGMIYGTSSSDQSSNWQLSTVKPVAHFWPSHEQQTEQKHQNHNEILIHENKQLSPSEGFPPHLININHFCPPQLWNQNNSFYGSNSYFLYSGYALPTASFGANNQQSPTMMNYTPYFYP